MSVIKPRGRLVQIIKYYCLCNKYLYDNDILIRGNYSFVNPVSAHANRISTVKNAPCAQMGFTTIHSVRIAAALEQAPVILRVIVNLDR